jgi:hypothetical protein
VTAIDFRAAARARARAAWSGLDDAERRARVKAEKVRWLRVQLGGDAAAEGYAAWLRAQPTSVQDQILGAARAAQLRAGALPVRQFTDPPGRPLSLDELAATRPEEATRPGPTAPDDEE